MGRGCSIVDNFSVVSLVKFFVRLKKRGVGRIIIGLIVTMSYN